MFLTLKEFTNFQNNTVAIVIVKTSYGNNHTGILTKLNDKINFYHLAWHLKLECINWERLKEETSFIIKRWVKFEYLTSDPSIVENRVPAIVKKIELIYRENIGKIPYAFNFNQTTFTEDGHLKLGEGEHGLTCSTFVASFFNDVGIKLVNLDTWILRTEDVAWKNWMIGMMMSLEVSEDHINNVEKESFNYRLRAEEISVASSKSIVELPADYDFCSAEGAYFNLLPLD